MNRSRVLALGGAAGALALLGGCVAPGPAVYGDYPYYPATAPAVIGPPAYVDIDVYPRPNYYGGRPYYAPRPGYPGYPFFRPGHYGPHPYVGVPRPGFPAGPRAVPLPRPPALMAPPTHGSQLRVPPRSRNDTGP